MEEPALVDASVNFKAGVVDTPGVGRCMSLRRCRIMLSRLLSLWFILESGWEVNS